MATQSFKSFGALANHVLQFTKNQVMTGVLREGMTASAHVVKNRAVGNLGHYPEAAGGYGPWAPLAAATQERRTKLGYSPNDPLYMTGALSASYEVDAQGAEVGVGSESPVALGQEVGIPSKNVPARPVLGLAFVQSEKFAFAALVDTVQAALDSTGPANAYNAARSKARLYRRRTIITS